MPLAFRLPIRRAPNLRLPRVLRPHCAAWGAPLLLAAASVSPRVAAQEWPVFPPTSIPAEETWNSLFDSDGDSDDSFRARTGPVELVHPEPLANFRLVMEYRAEVGGAAAELRVGETFRMELVPGGERGMRRVELAFAHPADGDTAHATAWLDDELLFEQREIPDTATSSGFVSSPGDASSMFRFDRDFTVFVCFENAESGTLAARCAPGGEWTPDAKALFIRDGRLVYDIGWLGAMTSKARVDDGGAHSAALIVEDGEARMYLDGKLDARRADFARPDVDGHVFKIGEAAEDFGGRFHGGNIRQVRWYARALGPDEAETLTSDGAATANTPDFEWFGPPIVTAPTATDGAPLPPGIGSTVALALPDGFVLESARWQPLESVDHAALIRSWNPESLARGETIYRTLCVTCHGTAEQEGTLPTATKFHNGTFRNGADPYRMFQTLSRGYGLMVAQPQYTPAQRYDVIHYIRETFLRPHNRDQWIDVDADYLAALPRSLHAALPAPDEPDGGADPDALDESPPYERMDFGPFLAWTYQIDNRPVADGNFAFKGIAVRLDPGEGGVSKGRAWMLYDHDTLRLAAAWTGTGFVDWKGIAFDGSHGTHTRIAAEPDIALPMAPGWANPSDGGWDDPRLVGRDGRRYGPLPRAWARHRGIHLRDERVILEYEVGSARVLESPGFIEYGTGAIFVRHLHVTPASHALVLRLAPIRDEDEGEEEDERETSVHLRASGRKAPVAALEPDEAGAFLCLRIPPRREALQVSVHLSGIDAGSLAAIADAQPPAPDLARLVRDAEPAPEPPPPAITEIERGDDEGPFAVDTLTHPEGPANPPRSWMRLSGLDFLPGGDRLAVCTWLGDVWIVDGIAAPDGELRWTRFASGLFQPLGLKVVGDVIHVACRDQIARLHDRNGDGRADHIECFNNDHQVTEHFHEFAMGLQADAAGNLYYAKSARHALPAVVPHHGTLLRVAADGSRTDILATGFRAANGVCLDPDGTCFVTDQEGHWIPKNRINRVVPDGRFFGNMLGFHDVDDASDDAMEQPLCWITNAFDRSPSELVRVPPDVWGNLGGTLLNFSYGEGRIFVVPHELVGDLAQGGMCALPIPTLPTGVMRGRFHPETGDLYACGMFAWGGNRQQPGGLYRIRRTAVPAVLPVSLQAESSGLRVRFSDAIDPESAQRDPGRFDVKVWGLRRSAGYGSPHVDERTLAVASVDASPDGREIVLRLPGLEPTRCMEIVMRLPLPGGGEVERTIHNTIHRLPDAAP